MVWPGSRHLLEPQGVFVTKDHLGSRTTDDAFPAPFWGATIVFVSKMRERNIGQGTLVDLDRNGLLVVML